MIWTMLYVQEECICITNPFHASLKCTDKQGFFLGSFVSCCGDRLICTAVTDSINCFGLFCRSFSPGSWISFCTPQLSFGFNVGRKTFFMFLSLLKNQESVGLRLPAGTVTSDVGSTVTLGGIVVNLCFYRVRASGDLTPPPSRKTLDLCLRWIITSKKTSPARKYSSVDPFEPKSTNTAVYCSL